MNYFINSLTVPQWIILAAVPPAIISLYFLKLKRHPLEVPSTYLWTRTIEDLHVNSIWQRLRQSLLLFLQLLVVMLAILACIRPGFRGAELVDERIIFLIDNSASMSASDVAPSRLEAAKKRVLDLIDQMTTSKVAMVISFSDVPKIEQSFTSSRSQLRQRIKRIQPSSRRSDLSDALRYAAGLANPGRSSEDANDVQVADALPATLYIFSDGGFRKVPDFSLGNLEPVYVKMGTDEPANVAIVSFNTERNPEKAGQTQAFARLENSGPVDETVEYELSLDGDLIDASNVSVPAGAAAGVNFDLQDLAEGQLQLQLQHDDHLQLDNTAYAVMNTPRRANVLLVTPKNAALSLAMSTEQARRVADVESATPDILATKEYQTSALAGAYDLIIYDQCVPLELPQANTLTIGNLPPSEDWSAGERKTAPVILDTDPVHPLTQLVEMGNVKWNYDGFSIKGPEGATALFESNIGPLLVIAQRDGYEDVVLGFEIFGSYEDGEIGPKSEWPIRRSFPVFVMNALRYLGGTRGALAMAGVQPGVPIKIRSLYPVDHIRVRTPSKVRSDLTREGQNTFIYSQTAELGIYDVQEGESREVAQRFAVNLFDNRESNLRPEPMLKIKYDEIEGRSGLEPSRKELWKWLLLAGLVVLIFEWYVYNRRVYL